MIDKSRLTLARLVRDARGDRSQLSYAKSIGVSQGTIANWESGSAFPGAEHFEAIARSCGMSVQDFVSVLFGIHAKELAAPEVAEDILPLAKHLPRDEIKRLITILLADV